MNDFQTPPLLRAGLALAACLAAIPLAAAEAPATRSLRLDTVVVTATRRTEDPMGIPAAIARIDGRDIARARARVNVAEVLQRVAGVVARDRQNAAQDTQISIRGFGARATFGVRGVRLYTDGIPASSPDGQGQVSHFALDAAESIEVLRGPFSALYGNSSGGVIQIFSAPPPEHPQSRSGLFAGSDGAWRLGIGIGAPFAAGAAAGGYRLDASRFATGGYRDHSGSQRTGTQLLSDFEIPSGDVRILANTVYIEADDPQGLTRGELAFNRRAASPAARLFDTRKRVRQEQIGARARRALGDSFDLTLVAHTGRRDTVQFLSVPVGAQSNPLSGGGVIDLERRYAGVDARLQHTSEAWSRPLTWTAGVELQSSDENRLGFENFVGSTLGVRGALRRDERNRVQALDPYVQLDWEIAPRWRVLAGARHSEIEFRSRDAFVTANNPDDSGSLSFAEFTPVVGVSFRALPELSFYANAGRGFETPTFNELAYRADAQSGLNTELQAARSDNAEAGVRVRVVSQVLEAAVFRSRTEGELAVSSNRGGRSTFTNAGVSRRQGIELSAQGAISARWRYAFAYAWLDARYRDAFSVCTGSPCARPNETVAAGSRIPGLSRHSGFAELVFEPVDQVDVALAMRGNDRIIADDRNSDGAPGFVAFDLSATRRWRFDRLDLEAFARVDNLLDHDIVGSVIVNEANRRFFEASPGRSYSLGLDATLTFD